MTFAGREALLLSVRVIDGARGCHSFALGAADDIGIARHHAGSGPSRTGRWLHSPAFCGSLSEDGRASCATSDGEAPGEDAAKAGTERAGL